MENRMKARDEVRYKIKEIFTKEIIKELYTLALSVDIPDNNDKAIMLSGMLDREFGKGVFEELGTGTNRIAFLYTKGGFVVKIALDRRGFTDNWAEFKRSPELQEYCAKAYETNMLVLISEYVVLMSDEEFANSRNEILTILEDISKEYIMGDVGYIKKNRCNFGYRDRSKTIVILDYGYVYPKINQTKAMTCPRCKGELVYTQNYDAFICTNHNCKNQYTFMDIRRRMILDFENLEDKMISELTSLEMPDMTDVNLFK